MYCPSSRPAGPPVARRALLRFPLLDSKNSVDARPQNRPARGADGRTGTAPAAQGRTEMSLAIRSPRDFWAGLLYSGVGAAAIVIARDYNWGRGGRMGPGYFPTILGALLLLVGIAALVRAFLFRGEPIGPIAWKGTLLVSGATVLFGVAAATGRPRPGARRADPGQRGGLGEVPIRLARGGADDRSGRLLRAGVRHGTGPAGAAARHLVRRLGAR